jgi:hypothetical protein
MSNQPQPTFKPRFDYAHMMQQVGQANGEWVELPIDQLAGDTLKRSKVLSHAPEPRASSTCRPPHMKVDCTPACESSHRQTSFFSATLFRGGSLI